VHMTADASLAPAPSTRKRFTYFSPAQTLLLHLLPGVAITLAFVAISALTRPLGWPASLSLLLAWPLVGLPVLIGILYHQARRHDVLLLYRQPLPPTQYLWLVPILIIWSALVSTLLLPLGESIRVNLFGAWPAWLDLTTLARDPTQFPRQMLWTVLALSAVLNVVVPITEELYYRSFLLPRVPVSPRIAAACRCSQEVRALGDDPTV
jgi:uncharacterized protein